VASRDPEIAARWITEHVGQDYARNTLRPIAAEWLVRDPQSTFDWLVSLPEDSQRDHILFNSFGRWFDEDPLNAQRWLEAETLQPAHDLVLDAFARRLSRTSSARALHWAEMIEDPSRREQSLIVVGQNWYRKQPNLARSWLEESDLSEDARAAVLNPPAREAETEAEDDDPAEDELDAPV
jgi:hypothetical protein